MADTLAPCPKCSSEYTYEMGELLVCPECGYECLSRIVSYLLV